MSPYEFVMSVVAGLLVAVIIAEAYAIVQVLTR